MYRCQLFDRLHFDDDEIFDDQIDAIPCVERDTFVDDLNGPLGNESELAERQLILQALHVRRFQQPRHKSAVYVNRSADDVVREGSERRVDGHAMAASKRAAVVTSGLIRKRSGRYACSPTR